MNEELSGEVVSDLINRLRDRVPQEELDQGSMIWPGDLSEDEQVAFMSLYKPGDMIGIISFHPRYARECIKAGKLLDGDEVT